MILVLITLAMTIYLYIKDHKKFAIYYALASLISMVLINMILKNLVARPRPDISLRLVDIFSPSYPSGHSLSSLYNYWTISYILKKIESRAKKPLEIFLYLLPFLVGVSRLYLGVHYLTDVLGGFLLGSFCHFLFISLWETRLSKKMAN